MPLVRLSLTYEVDHIPYDHKKPRPETVRDAGSVEIKEIAPGSAPVSHRILDRLDRIQTEVRYYDNGFWWLLNEVDKPMSLDRFTSSPDDLDWPILEALDIRGFLGKQTEDDLRAKKSRILRTEKESQWRKAQAGADKIFFCESRVWVEAGPPNYFGAREGTTISFSAGPSSLERIRGADPLFGPGLNDRQFSARRGLAFDVDEFEGADFHEQAAGKIEVLHRVENVLRLPLPRMALEGCARELAAYLWRERTSRLVELVPSLAGSPSKTRPDDEKLIRDLLEEFAALTENEAGIFSDELEGAREIIRRFNSRPLNEQEDAAIASLGI